MSDWLLILVAALVTLSLVRVISVKGALKEIQQIISMIRMRIILQTLLIVALSTGVYFALKQLPGFNWGWMSLLSEDGSVDNINLIGFQSIWFAPVGALFVVALPKLAQLEEEFFRGGTPNWTSGIKRSIGFGVAHLFAGISLAIVVVAIITGIWYTYQYFKGGVKRSTVYHTAYNLTVLIVAIMVSFLS